MLYMSGYMRLDFVSLCSVCKARWNKYNCTKGDVLVYHMSMDNILQCFLLMEVQDKKCEKTLANASRFAKFVNFSPMDDSHYTYSIHKYLNFLYLFIPKLAHTILANFY